MVGRAELATNSGATIRHRNAINGCRLLGSVAISKNDVVLAPEDIA
jgi:hypothetical protein